MSNEEKTSKNCININNLLNKMNNEIASISLSEYKKIEKEIIKEVKYSEEYLKQSKLDSVSK